MPSFYRYRKVTDDYTTYHPLLPESGVDQPDAIDLGEIDGEIYVCVPDWMIPLPRQPKQIVMEVVQQLDSKLIGRLAETSPVIKLTKMRMAGLSTRPRYSKADELTLMALDGLIDPVYSSVEKSSLALTDHIAAQRAWDILVIKPDDPVIKK